MYTIKGETDYRPRLDAWDKRSDLVLWEDLEGAGGEGGGRGDRDGEDMWTQGLFISIYEKIHYKKKKKFHQIGGMNITIKDSCYSELFAKKDKGVWSPEDEDKRSSLGSRGPWYGQDIFDNPETSIN